MLRNVSPSLSPAPSPIALLRSRDLRHPERAVARNALVPVRRGIYAPAAPWLALAPWDRYLARVHAVALTHPDAVFSHDSAAALLGLPVFGDPAVVHILRDIGATARLGGGIRMHTAAIPREVRDLGGLLTTSPAETAVDLARSRQEATAVAVADAALRCEPTLSVEALVAVNEARASSRGRRRARWALHRATALAETALESVSRAAIEWLGFAEPELQQGFPHADANDRGDFWWREVGVLGEADGDLKYDGRFGDPVALLRDRRRRDARLRTVARAVVHWAWGDVTAIAPFRTLLTGAGVPRVRTEDTARLHAMRHALSPSPDTAPP